MVMHDWAGEEYFSRLDVDLGYLLTLRPSSVAARLRGLPRQRNLARSFAPWLLNSWCSLEWTLLFILRPASRILLFACRMFRWWKNSDAEFQGLACICLSLGSAARKFSILYEIVKSSSDEIQDFNMVEIYWEGFDGDGQGRQFYACEGEAAVAGGCLPQRFASSENSRGPVIHGQFKFVLSWYEPLYKILIFTWKHQVIPFSN